MSRLLPGFAILAALAACDEPEPFARAYRAESPDQLIGGDVAHARVGDFILENDRIRVAILDKDSSPAPGVFGGTLVDADLQRPEAEFRNGVGRDQLAEVIPVVNLLWPRPGVGEVTIVSDGSDGGAAVIRVAGGTGIFLEALSILRSDLLERLFRGVDFDFNIQTDYILEPGKSYVRIKSVAFRIGEDVPAPSGDPLPLPSVDGSSPIFTAILGDAAQNLKPGIMAGDFLFFGARNDIFAPGMGFDEEKPIFDALFEGRDTFTFPLSFEYMAASGGDVSYGYFNLKTEGQGEPQVLVPIITSSSTGFVTSANNCSTDGADDATCDAFAQWSWERYLVVGKGDVASVADEVYAARGVATGTIRGVVRGAQGEPLPNATVSVMRDPDPSRTWTDVDAVAEANLRSPLRQPGLVSQIAADVGRDPIDDGDFRATLPPGDYLVFAQNPRRTATSPLQRVKIVAGETITVAPVVPRPGRVRLRIVDQNNGLLDAKVNFVPILADGTRADHDGLRRPWLGEGRLGNGVKHFQVVLAEETVADVEPGRYAVVASHGPEWSIAEKEITISSGEELPLSLVLVHEVDTAGWISGDFHLHAEGSFDSGMYFEERLRRALIENVELAVATDHDIVTDYRPYLRNIGAYDRLSTGIGVELSTLELGHFIAFPLEYDQSIIPHHGAPDWTCKDGPAIMSLLSEKIADPKGGVRIMAHPRDGFIGHISQIGLDGVAGNREITLLERSNVLLSQTSCDIDAMEVFNSKRFDLVRSPTNSEVILYNRCVDRIDQAQDTAALDAACPELSPGEPLASCPADERLSECKYRYRRRLAFLSAREILIRTPEEQLAIWNHVPSDDDGDACVPASHPADISADIAMLPCVEHPGTYDDWMRWLDKGLNVTITGASDSHGNEREPGTPRTWVRQEATPGHIDPGEAARAVRDGHALASFGPFIRVSVGGKEPGETASVSGATFDLAVDVRTASWFGVDRVEIYVGGLLEKVVELDHGPEVVEDYKETVSLPVPAEDSFVSVIALGTREENLMRKVVQDVPFGELQLPRVASLAFGAIPAFALLLTPTPSVPDFFPVFPMATTNAILLDVDGDGEWKPAGPLPSFCARPCTNVGEKDECIAGEECLPTGFCGIAIEGQCLTGPPGTEWSIFAGE